MNVLSLSNIRLIVDWQSVNHNSSYLLNILYAEMAKIFFVSVKGHIQFYYKELLIEVIFYFILIREINCLIMLQLWCVDKQETLKSFYWKNLNNGNSEFPLNIFLWQENDNLISRIKDSCFNRNLKLNDWINYEIVAIILLRLWSLICILHIEFIYRIQKLHKKNSAKWVTSFISFMRILSWDVILRFYSKFQNM